jgi:hypothetical protein
VAAQRRRNHKGCRFLQVCRHPAGKALEHADCRPDAQVAGPTERHAGKRGDGEACRSPRPLRIQMPLLGFQLLAVQRLQASLRVRLRQLLLLRWRRRHGFRCCHGLQQRRGVCCW